jgi:hypothetical protein
MTGIYTRLFRRVVGQPGVRPFRMSVGTPVDASTLDELIRSPTMGGYQVTLDDDPTLHRVLVTTSASPSSSALARGSDP